MLKLSQNMANPRYTYCPQVNSYIDPEHSSLLVDSAVDSNLQAIYLAGSMLVGGVGNGDSRSPKTLQLNATAKTTFCKISYFKPQLCSICILWAVKQPAGMVGQCMSMLVSCLCPRDSCRQSVKPDRQGNPLPLRGYKVTYIINKYIYIYYKYIYILYIYYLYIPHSTRMSICINFIQLLTDFTHQRPLRDAIPEPTGCVIPSPQKPAT